MMKSVAAGMVAAALAVAAAPAMVAAAADAAVPTATAIIFDRPHLANVAKGDELVYKFVRRASADIALGRSFDDEIKLKIEDVTPDGKRNINLQIYTGDRARDPQPITDLTINPVFVVVMQQAVASFRLLAGGDLGYLKNRFSLNLRDKATVTPVKFDYKGEVVDGYKIELEPWGNDPSKAKMSGYDASKFTFVVSSRVPGEIAETVSDTQSTTKEAVSLQERTTIAGFGGMK